MPKKPQEVTKMQIEENLEEISLSTENEVLKVEVADLQRQLAATTLKMQEQQRQLLQRQHIEQKQIPQPQQTPQSSQLPQPPSTTEAYMQSQHKNINKLKYKSARWNRGGRGRNRGRGGGRVTLHFNMW